MISAESFWTASLHSSARGDSITRILSAAIKAVDPGEAVKRHVRRSGKNIIVSGQIYDLSRFRKVGLLGIGKASLAMAESLAGILADRLDSGLVVSKHSKLQAEGPAFPFKVIKGGHPIPDESSLVAGGLVIDYVSSMGQDDLLFCVISGGGSALVTAPVDGVSLADLQSMTSNLLSCGASVAEINFLRRQLDRVKGGGLVTLANGATIVSLIISDVVGNPLEAIASGPTVHDPSTKEMIVAIINKYGLLEKIPDPIIRSLLSGKNNFEKPEDHRTNNVLVASNLLAAQAALVEAKNDGFHPYLLRTDLQGEARTVATELSILLRQAWLTGDPVSRPACIVAGGETTVTIKGNGRGGRNTELALASVTELAGFPGVLLASLATDGEDGPTEAAGAVVTGDTYKRASALSLNPMDFLERNDSYHFFEPLGDLLTPGSTGTNVSDLIFLFTF